MTTILSGRSSHIYIYIVTTMKQIQAIFNRYLIPRGEVHAPCASVIFTLYLTFISIGILQLVHANRRMFTVIQNDSVLSMKRNIVSTNT